MDYVYKLADELALEAIDISKRTGDDLLVDQIAEVVRLRLRLHQLIHLLLRVTSMLFQNESSLGISKRVREIANGINPSFLERLAEVTLELVEVTVMLGELVG